MHFLAEFVGVKYRPDVVSQRAVPPPPRPPRPLRPPRPPRPLAPEPLTDGETAGGGCAAAAANASAKLRMTLRRLWFGMSVLLSSLAPVFGEVSLVQSHSVIASRS